MSAVEGKEQQKKLRFRLNVFRKISWKALFNSSLHIGQIIIIYYISTRLNFLEASKLNNYEYSNFSSKIMEFESYITRQNNEISRIKDQITEITKEIDRISLLISKMANEKSENSTIIYNDNDETKDSINEKTDNAVKDMSNDEAKQASNEAKQTSNEATKHASNETIKQEASEEKHEQKSATKDDLKKVKDKMNVKLAYLLKLGNKKDTIINLFPVVQFRREWKSIGVNFCELEYQGEIYWVKASDSEDINHCPANMFSEDCIGSARAWISRFSRYNWVTLAYPKPVRVNYCLIVGRTNHPNQFPKNFEIRATNTDFSPGEYVVLGRYTDQKSGQRRIFRFDNFQKFRFYQLYIISTDSPYIGISKLTFGFEISMERLDI